MTIEEVQKLVEELYPELSGVTTVWSDRIKYKGEVLPAGWYLYVHLGSLGIEMFFLPGTLRKLKSRSVEKLVVILKDAFSRKRKLEELEV